MTPETRQALESVEFNDLDAAVDVARRVLEEDGEISYVVIQALIHGFDDAGALLDAIDALPGPAPSPLPASRALRSPT